jgi:chromosome segregation ATPase
VVEATTELRQTIESLKTDLSDARARVAALEKEKAAADNAVKQAEKARSDAEKSRRDTENGRLADRTKLNALSAQFEAYKESANTKSDWWWAYALIAGVIGVMAGLAGFPFIKRMRQSPTS